MNNKSYSNELIDEDSIKNNLYNLYLLITSKVLLKNEINISKATISDLLLVLKNAIEHLLSMINNNKTKAQLQLENHIIKIEADLRHYIKREFQTKIQKDALEMKIKAYMGLEDEYEMLKEKVRYEGGKFLNNERKDNEIIILRQENSLLKKDITKHELKIKELNDIIKEKEDLIKASKYKSNQLSKLINELKNIKNNSNIHNIHNNSSINLNIINNNNGNKNNSVIHSSSKKMYNATLTKKYFETLNKNYKNTLHLKQRLTLYHSPKNTYYENNNNIHNKSKMDLNKKNKITNTLDNNKLFTKTYNKIFNNGTCKYNSSNKYRNKKIKSTYISMRLEDNEKSDIINKYLSINNSNSKHISSIKTKSYNKISKSIPKYKVPLTNKNESFVNNYGNIKHSMSKKTFRKEYRANDHSALIMKKIKKKC